MRFERIYMNGFGMYRDRMIELDPEAPAALFIGRNEAGKSTMMGFIRSMLFGFPTRAHMPLRYEPVHGGLHGGALTVRTDQGQSIRIERYERNRELKLIYADGETAGEAALHRLLGGMTEEVYRNIFAFGLSELQQLDSLRGEEISGFLYSSGMGLSGSAIVQAERRLAQQMEQLYKPRGTKQALNIALKEMEEGESELRRSKALSGQFSEWQAELEALGERIREQERMIGQLRVRRDWLNKCRQAQPIWLKLLELERELSLLGEWHSVPEDAVARLEQLDIEQDGLLERGDALDLKQEKLRDRRAQLEGISRSRGEAAPGSRRNAWGGIIAGTVSFGLLLLVWLLLGGQAAPMMLLSAGLAVGAGVLALFIWLRTRAIDRERDTTARQLELERLSRLQEDELELHQERELIDQSMKRLDRRRQSLFREAGVENETRLRHAHRQFMRASGLLQEKRQVEVQLAAWIKEEQRAQLRDMLDELDVRQLELRGQELGEQLAETERTLNELLDKRGRLRGELERLSAGTAHAEQLHRQQERIAEFEQSAQSWMQLALASALIRQSRAIYERDRQPGVLRQASGYFAAITGGRYARVISRLGEKAIYAERANGELVESAYLSRGTAEQLYLSMRLALADEYAQTAALPIVMDDIFVNFDRERLRETLSVLQDVARRRQLLLFTCHEHVEEAVREALPDIQTIPLYS